ncbi:MAG TPA: GGDEF domain-containing protein [Holophagaceae bacterium]|nr:GGDEF domain-containing protein [Holophagaceae bacterium]
MRRIHWVQAGLGGEELRHALLAQGYLISEEPAAGSTVIVSRKPDPALLPPNASEVLWWVQDATPEETSRVLALRPGWVVRQSQRLELALEALETLRRRELGSEGWLRQMLHLATLPELLRLVITRAVKSTRAAAGAVWIRHEDTYYQRQGDGWPEAPLTRDQAAAMLRSGEALELCPMEAVGILALRDPKNEPEPLLGWLKDVEPLLTSAWHLEESRALSFRDDLTVAQNRRCLEEELPRLVRESAAKREALALLFLDVDNLKQVNTQHGHPAGSRVLQAVAEGAQRVIRAHDRIYRYGGDEFCILMPGTAAQGAAKLGERLIRILSERPIPTEAGPLPVSLSIGIAAFPEHAQGAEQLLARADQALLEAKRSGKGRVVVSD